MRILISITLTLAALVACTEPEDSTPSYWDGAEVRSTCDQWAAKLVECETNPSPDAPSESEFSSQCQESVAVDNPEELAGCYDAILARFECEASLACEMLTDPESICLEEKQTVAEACN